MTLLKNMKPHIVQQNRASSAAESMVEVTQAISGESGRETRKWDGGRLCVGVCQEYLQDDIHSLMRTFVEMSENNNDKNKWKWLESAP